MTDRLIRSIGLVQATSLVVGTIIGASIFVQPSEITSQIPSVGGIVLVWLLSGLLTLCGALVCAELASAYPRTGGVAVFLSESLGPAVGFLWGWAMFWSVHSGIIAAIALVFARYVGYFLPLEDAGTRLAAVTVILATSAINCTGVRPSSRLQTTFTIGKLAVIGLLIVLGIALPSSAVSAGASGPPPTGLDGLTPDTLLLALIAGLFAFGGWHMVTYTAGETVDPVRTIPRALTVGTALVTVTYIALNAVYLHVLPLETVARSTRIAADAADALLGAGGATAMSAVVVFSTFGSLIGIVLAGPRVYFAMAGGQGPALSWLAAVHPRFGTPHRAIVAQAVWSSVLVLLGTYRTLFVRVIYTEWFFFALMAIGLMVLRRRPDYDPAYRMHGYPLVPLLFVVGAAAIIVNHVISSPLEGLYGVVLVGAGVPFYLLVARRRGIP